MKNSLILVMTLMTLSAVGADQFIVKYKEGYKPVSKLGLRGKGPLFLNKKLNEKQNIYTVRFPLGLRPRAIQNELETLRSQPEVEYAQLDHVVSLRNGRSFDVLPDDENVANLWSMANATTEMPGATNASKAWANFGVGGKDVYGQEIVVAVIDGGFDISHEDLFHNIWVNTDEVPGNGIDDDNNGYIDDMNGWSTSTNSGTITPASHGTHVAGIIGAVGNNGIGVAGINWDVKVMPIQLSMSSDLKTSDVVKAYSYIIDQKTEWFNSGGQTGANIVVTNSSFGIDGADCNDQDFPVWNELYEKMGQLGILSAVATANQAYDVEEVGDVPSACDSPSIIAVTNIQHDGAINDMAAWGANSIDLAAPGSMIYSTVTDSWYQWNTGTSMATPHVAGAVAYLHSAASQAFVSYYYSNPLGASDLLKEVIMQTTRPMNSMQNVTVSGGTLDVYEAALLISDI